MLLFVTLLHIILCFILMLVILLQPGKGSDVGAAFGGGGGSSSIFGPRGAGSFLSQATTIVAVLFMFSSIYLAWNSSASVRSGSDVEDAMKRLTRERIEGDVYQVPDGGIEIAAPVEPASEVPAEESASSGEAGADAPADQPVEEAQPVEGAADGAVSPGTPAPIGAPPTDPAPTVPAAE